MSTETSGALSRVHGDRFQVHGLRLSFSSDSSLLREFVGEMLAPFREHGPGPPHEIELTLDSASRRKSFDPAASPGHHLLSTVRTITAPNLPVLECSIYSTTSGIVLDFGPLGCVECVDHPPTVRGILVRPDGMDHDTRAGILLFVFREILKRRGCFSIHAGCVARGNEGVVFAGASGSGKSTCSVAMLRVGFCYLTDDCVFFRVDDGNVRLLAFPHPPRLRQGSLRFFPECRLEDDPLLVYSGRIQMSCRPRLLVFPKILDARTSAFRPMRKIEALHRLLPQSLLISDRLASRRQLDALSTFVEKVPCLELALGQDIADLPRLIDGLLEGQGG